jgi:hypothetical protein
LTIEFYSQPPYILTESYALENTLRDISMLGLRTMANWLPLGPHISARGSR